MVSLESVAERIYEVVRQVPRGRVATYGQIAALAGIPRHARLVGRALREAPPDLVLPWHRIVNASGRVSRRSRGDSDDLQPILLAAEGVDVKENGLIPLREFQWDEDALRELKIEN